MKEITKTYKNGALNIIWKPHVCIHSTNCWNQKMGLPDVFNPMERPWIKPLNADQGTIIEHIKKCPSGALSYTMDDEKTPENSVLESIATTIEVIPNGPLMIHGSLKLKGKDGEDKHLEKPTAFCRCGHSENKPFCDGSHRKKGFEG